MKSVSIRELHTRTGHYVRAAALSPIEVTDRGRTVARLVPATELPRAVRFSERKLLPGFRRLLEKPMGGTDSSEIISQDRDR